MMTFMCKKGGMVTVCYTCGAVDKMCSECMELMKYTMKVRINTLKDEINLKDESNKLIE